MASVKDLENVANNLNNNIISVENNLNNNIVGVVDNLQRQLNKNKKEIDMLKNKLETVESDHENLLGNETDTYFISIIDRNDPNKNTIVKIKDNIGNEIHVFTKNYVVIGNKGPYYLNYCDYAVGVKIDNDKEGYSFLLSNNRNSIVATSDDINTKTDNVIFITSDNKELYLTMDKNTKEIYLTVNSNDPNLERYKSSIEIKKK